MTQPRLQDVTPAPAAGGALSLQEIIRQILAGNDLSGMTIDQIAQLINQLVRTLPAGGPTAVQIGEELFKTPGLQAAVEANQTRAAAQVAGAPPSPVLPDDFGFEQLPIAQPQVAPPPPIDQPIITQQGFGRPGGATQATRGQLLQQAEASPRNVFQSFLQDVLPATAGPTARAFANRQLPQLQASFFAQRTPEFFRSPADLDDPNAPFREFLMGGGQALSAGDVGQNLVRLNELFQNPAAGDAAGAARLQLLRETFTPQRTFETALAPALAGISPGFRQTAENILRRQFAAELGGGADPSAFFNRLAGQGGTLLGVR